MSDDILVFGALGFVALMFLAVMVLIALAVDR